MRRFIRKYLFSLQLHVMLIYRMSHYSYFHIPWMGRTLAVAFRHFMRIYSSCDISPTAKISKSCRFHHPLGIVIGDGVVVGKNVKIWHRVTLGSDGRAGGTRKYPVVEDDVRIFNGATVVGAVTLGRGCTIGAHAFVSIDVPAGTTAVGIPARILNNDLRADEEEPNLCQRD